MGLNFVPITTQRLRLAMGLKFRAHNDSTTTTRHGVKFRAHNDATTPTRHGIKFRALKTETLQLVMGSHFNDHNDGLSICCSERHPPWIALLHAFQVVITMPQHESTVTNHQEIKISFKCVYKLCA